MRVGWIVGLVVLIAAVAVAAIVGLSVQVGPVISVCSHNDEIPTGERAEIVEAGQDFMALVRSEDAAAVRGAMSRDGQAGTELATLANLIRGQHAGADITLADTYKVDTPVGSRNGSSLCGAPSQPALLSRHGGAHVALVTFEQPLSGATRTWTLYFERDGGEWRVRHFHVGLSGLAGRDGRDIRELARAQDAAGHAFNATLLYDTAGTLLSRGESFQPSEACGLARERETLRRHPDIAGAAPYAFQLGDASFAVKNVSIVGAGGDQSLVLILNQPGEALTETEASARNRLLIDAMNLYRPGWREVFDALVASYPTSANAVWRTVYDPDRGYLSDPEPFDRRAPN
jgi:hypothetical protein